MIFFSISASFIKSLIRGKKEHAPSCTTVSSKTAKYTWLKEYE